MALTNAGAGIMLQAISGLAMSSAVRHCSLHVGQPSASGVEVTGTGYARLARNAATASINQNIMTVAMGEWDDSADASWGTPTWLGVYTTLTGGTLLWELELSPTISEIVTGTRVFTNAGDIEFRVPLS